MFEFLADSLAFFYDIWPSFGGAIILLTAAIMLLLTPLSIKTTRSMIAMQRVGPELKKLQAQYKDDRETLNKEMMAFYKENNINPFSSCLPMLLQMPVFFVLYQVLNGLTRIGEDGNFNPKYLEDDNSAFAEALRNTDEMVSFGIDLSQSMMQTLSGANGIVSALPYALLVAAVVGTAFIQQRQIQGRNTASINPQQAMIGKIMPFIFIPISVSIAAGVVLYFFVSNLVRVGQQALVTRLEYGEKADARRAAAEAAKGSKKAADDGGDTKVIDAPSTPKKTSRPPAKQQSDGRSGGGGNGRNGSNGSPRKGAGACAGARSSSQSRNRKKKKRK
jgi:YidC/Oxa1 family membrane protein insertase